LQKGKNLVKINLKHKQHIRTEKQFKQIRK
jgi:hypothetical protein